MTSGRCAHLARLPTVELFGSRTRFTQLAPAKGIGGIVATAIGPVVAATLTAVTGSWCLLDDPPPVRRARTETRGRDLVRLEDAA